MKYTIPFDESIKDELSDSMAMSLRRKVSTNEISAPQPFEMPEFCTQNGVIGLLNEKGAVEYVIDSVKVTDNVCYLSGTSYGIASKGGPAEVLLFERKPLGDDFHIVISSHVDYVDVTLDRLLRSLRKEGISNDRITVAVAGCEETCASDYVSAPDLGGCTGLAAVSNGSIEIDASYVLLLHDTCEVCHGFADAVSAVEVGLPFGFIGMGSENVASEMGFWSASLLQSLSPQVFDFALSQIPSAIWHTPICKMVTRLGQPKTLRKKDVYGTGTVRKVVELGLPVKKFLGQSMTGGRP